MTCDLISLFLIRGKLYCMSVVPIYSGSVGPDVFGPPPHEPVGVPVENLEDKVDNWFDLTLLLLSTRSSSLTTRYVHFNSHPTSVTVDHYMVL